MNMSETLEKTAVAEESTPAKETAKAKKPISTEKSSDGKILVYCGPTIKGVAKQYTVYRDDAPSALKELLNARPALKGLLVEVGQFPEVRRKLGQKGTAEAILFEKLKEGLSVMRQA